MTTNTKFVLWTSIIVLIIGLISAYFIAQDAIKEEERIKLVILQEKEFFVKDTCYIHEQLAKLDSVYKINWKRRLKNAHRNKWWDIIHEYEGQRDTLLNRINSCVDGVEYYHKQPEITDFINRIHPVVADYSVKGNTIGNTLHNYEDELFHQRYPKEWEELHASARRTAERYYYSSSTNSDATGAALVLLGLAVLLSN